MGCYNAERITTKENLEQPEDGGQNGEDIESSEEVVRHSKHCEAYIIWSRLDKFHCDVDSRAQIELPSSLHFDGADDVASYSGPQDDLRSKAYDTQPRSR